MSRYRDSSGNAMGSLTPRLSAALSTDVWQEPGHLHVSAIYLRCTSSACQLSSICRQAITMAWMLSEGAFGHSYGRGSNFRLPLHKGLMCVTLSGMTLLPSLESQRDSGSLLALVIYIFRYRKI